MAEAEIMARRRKWSTEQKAALLSEVEAKGGRIAIVARRHGLSESLLYNWQSAWQAGSSARAPEAMQFMPLGVIDGPGGRSALLAAPEHLSDAREPPAAHVDHIEIELPNGVRVRVAGSVNGSPDQPHQRTVALAAITTVISTLQRRPAIRNIERLPRWRYWPPMPRTREALMAEYICPQDIQNHYREDPGEARMMLAEWLLNLDLKVGDRIWEPEEGWHEKTAETKWQ